MIYKHLRSEKGNVTVAMEFDDDVAVIGVAFCSPKDRFNRAKGRLIAGGRCEKASILTHDLRERGFKDMTLGHGFAQATFAGRPYSGFVIHELLGKVDGPGWFKSFLKRIRNERHRILYAMISSAARDGKLSKIQYEMELSGLVAIRFTVQNVRYRIMPMRYGRDGPHDFDFLVEEVTDIGLTVNPKTNIMLKHLLEITHEAMEAVA